MTLEWFGSPELAGFVAPWRYALVALALLWAVAAARAPRPVALLAGLLYASAAGALWILSLGRPYGLFEDAAATRRAAEVSVAAATGGAVESFVVGEPVSSRAFLGLLALGLSPDTLKLLPSLAPVLCLGSVGLLVFALWERRAEAVTAASLWLAFATSDLEAARGTGVLPRAWAHAESALALPVLVALALLLARLPGRLGTVAAALAGLSALAAPTAGPRPDLGDSLLLLTLDQMPWLVLAAVAARSHRDAAALGLVAGGGLAVGLGGGDAWLGHALFRLGLLLAVAAASAEPLRRLGERAGASRPRLAGLVPERLGLGLVLAASVPCAFTTWWDPLRTDRVAHASQEPISPALAPVMSFIRDETPKDAVFLASADYAPAVSVFGGRRVLRAPSVLVTADDGRRVRAEGAILAGRAPAGDGPRAGFVLLAPGDFKARGIQRPEDLLGRPGFRARYADDAGYRVYEVVR